MPSFQEFILIAIVIIVLSSTGLWPKVLRGFRELRGERFDDEPQPKSKMPSKSDLDLSYRLMGLSPSSNWDEIERAYRSKAKLHHPDKGGDEDTMRALNEAYTQIKRVRGR